MSNQHTGDLLHEKEALNRTLLSKKKKTVSSVTFVFVLNFSQNEYLHTYATTKELKKMALKINSQNIKQTFETQAIFISEIKPRPECFFKQNMTVFSETCVSILNPCQDRNVHTYATTKKLKKMAFRINSRIIK